MGLDEPLLPLISLGAWSPTCGDAQINRSGEFQAGHSQHVQHPAANNENTDKVRTMFTIKTGLVAVAAAAALGRCWSVATAPTSEAAANVTIYSANVTNTPDIKTKGTIRTPKIKTANRTEILSKSYTIYKGSRVVARTSTPAKAYKLSPGTYKLKTTVKYLPGHWETYEGTPDERWEKVTWKKWVAEHPGRAYAEDGSYINQEESNPSSQEVIITDSEGRTWMGLETFGSNTGDFEFTAYKKLVVTPTYHDEWVYDAERPVTKTQTIKLSKNSGTMTLYEYKKIKNKAKLSKVKSIVGGTGKVVDRWSCGETTTSPGSSTATMSTSRTARSGPSSGDAPHR